MLRQPLTVRLKTFLGFYYYWLFSPSREFTFEGNQYRYLHRRYNSTWRNERAVEVPICWKWVQSLPPERILEVGNVLSHYYTVRHAIVDKYERAPSVINQDIIEFKPERSYDLIVSISTLEHVGWDELPRDGSKILRAFEHLKNLLTPNGKIIATLPLGYNPFLDDLLRHDQIPTTRRYFMRKIAKPSTWAQVEWDDIKQGWLPFEGSSAGAVMVCILDKPGTIDVRLGEKTE